MDKALEKDCFILLHQNSTRAINFNFFVCTLLAFDLWFNNANILHIAIWAATIISLNILRLIFLTHIQKHNYFLTHRKFSRLLIISISLTLGLAWSSSYFIFLPILQGFNEMLIILTLGGLSAGAIASMSAYLPSFYSFMLGTLMPITLYSLSKFTLDSFVMTCLFLLYIAMLSFTASHYYKMIIETISLKIKKDSLLKKLKDSNSELIDANEKIQKISNTDSLTFIANRRHFDETLELEWRRAIRSQQPLSLLLIDIDNFKKINDTLGHPTGDRYLKDVALRMQNTIRRGGDFIARTGGDEFAVILPDTKLANATIIAEKIRSVITDLHEKYAQNLDLSVSIGISTIEEKNQTIEHLISTADKALYKAKSQGKNQVVFN